MCWEHRLREGITLSQVYFTPKNGTRRMVLNHAALAQIHVPYDDNGTRYHDISDFGIGGSNLLDMNFSECPSGTMYRITYTKDEETFKKNAFCKQVLENDLGFKSGQNTAKKHYLNLFSVSPVGAYYYIPTWRFMDDGSIEPWIGATGALQRFGDIEKVEDHGWKMSDGSIGISHLHNFYWKLDFDLNKTHLDDVVEEVNFTLSNGKRIRQTTVFNTEAARKVNPSTMRHWRISDKNTFNENNRNISYDILLNESGHQDIGPALEPFTYNDFFVTKQNDQEKFASHNTSGGNNLAEFVNGESIVNNDTVIWAGVTFYHVPRSEDAPHMDVHWSHFKVVPRDLSASNSLSGYTQINSSPNITVIANQASRAGASKRILVQASDADNDRLSYSATGLPTGITINPVSGIISGTPSRAGSYKVYVTAEDAQASSTASFTWSVSEASNSGSSNGNIGSSNGNGSSSNSGGGGSLDLYQLLIFFIFLLFIVLKGRYGAGRNA